VSQFLHTLQLNKMPPKNSRFDWVPFRHEIEGYRARGYSVQAIFDTLSEVHGDSISVKFKSLQRQIDEWNLSPKYDITTDEKLIHFVREEWLENSTHKEILVAVNDSPHLNLPHQLTSRQLKTLRLANNLKYARRDGITEEELEKQAKALLELLSDGGARLGRRQLLPALRKKGILISQKAIQEMLREVDSEGVQGRICMRRRRRGRMDVAGPGRVFSFDGYDKLLPWGIAIYGMIDGYSRYSLQNYSGNDNKTAVSVLVQYIRLVRRLGKIPMMIRCDKGVETPLLAWAHVLLRRHAKMMDEGENYTLLPFEKAFSWGTSTRNIRIERWWKFLATSALNEFREYFQSLTRTGAFTDCMPDRIAIKYIYMPLVRKRISDFMAIHNNHKIRKQRFRGHYLPTGKPRILFFHPDHKVDYHQAVHWPTLEWLEVLTKDVDIDSYLPESMMNLCRDVLDRQGLSSATGEELVFSKKDNSLHRRMYLGLRRELAVLYAQADEGGLQELPTPIGAREWIEKHINKDEDQELMNHLTGAKFKRLDLRMDEADDNKFDTADEEGDNSVDKLTGIWEDEEFDENYGSDTEVFNYVDYEEQ
jgi:hypothetical protein